MKNISTKSLLDYITLSVTANSEDDQAYLMRLLTPTPDRDEMGEVYNDLLGYNPITYFDQHDLSRAYADIITSDSFQKAPNHVKEFLSSGENKELIIERTLSLLDDDRDDYLVDLLVETIKDETNWTFESSDCEDIESFDADETDDDLCEEEDESDEDDDEDESEDDV